MKKNFSQEILIMAVLILTITFLWLYLSVYRVFKKDEKLILTPRQIQTLNPKLDESVFEELKKKRN